MLTEIAIKHLHPAPAEVNSRKSATSIKDLVASITAIGQLQPILVRPLETPGEYEIIDGHRRFAAMKEIANGHGDDTTLHAFVVDGIDHGAATEMSLAANVVREQLHPVDEYEAFAELVRQGMGVKEIAEAFAQTQKVVKQRIALGSAIPEVRNAWRNETINTETFKAFSILPADKQQEIWDAAKAEGLDGYRVYSFVKSKTTSATGKLERWVTKKEYEARGGTFAVDLFGEGGQYVDTELALQIARENLVAWKNDKLAEGWGNVVCPLLGDELISNTYSYPVPIPVDYEWDSEDSKTAAMGLEGWELKHHQSAHAKPLFSRDDMAAATLYVDENWYIHTPMLPKPKKDAAPETAVEEAGISGALRDYLNGLYSNALANAVMRDKPLAEALLLNALVESFIGRSWGQPTSIRGEHGKGVHAAASTATLLRSDSFEKMTTPKRVVAILNMKPKDRQILMAHLVGSMILGTDNKGDLAKLVGPAVPIEQEWNEEAKTTYFSKLKLPELHAFINEREPNRAGAGMKKAQAVEMCVKLCGDWMPKEITPPKKGLVNE